MKHMKYIINIALTAVMLIFAGCSSNDYKKEQFLLDGEWVTTIGDSAHRLLLFPDLNDAIYEVYEYRINEDSSPKLFGTGKMNVDGDNITFEDFIVSTNGVWIHIPKLKILYAKFEAKKKDEVFSLLHVTYQENINEAIYTPYNYEPIWSENKTETFVK